MAFDAFIKISTIEGESTDKGHEGWIEVLSYSHAVSQVSSGSVSSSGSRSAERCDHADFSIVKALDKTSPKLSVACCKGEHIPEIRIELCRAGGDKQPYMEYVLENVIISSVRPGGSSQGGESLPLEEVAFSYGKITWNYTILDQDTGQKKGQVPGWWDLKQNIGG